MIDLCDLRMILQVFDNLLRILCMTLQTQRERFRTLKQQECRKRRNCSALIAQQDRTDIGHKCSRADSIRKGNAVIARIRRCDRCIFAAGLPVKLAGIHDHAAERCAVSADELCCGMHNDIRTVLDRTNQERRTECIINDKRQAVLMRNLRNCVNIRNIGIRIAERFEIDRLRILTDRALDLCEIVRIDKGCLDAVLRERMCKEIVAAAVDRLLCDDVLPCLRERLNRVGLSHLHQARSKAFCFTIISQRSV